MILWPGTTILAIVGLKLSTLDIPEKSFFFWPVVPFLCGIYC